MMLFRRPSPLNEWRGGKKNSSAKKSKQGSELSGGGWGAERQANDFQGKPHKHAATGVHTHSTTSSLLPRTVQELIIDSYCKYDHSAIMYSH